MSLVSKLDHVAVAVKSLGKALPFYTEVLGLEIEGPVEVPERGVRAVFIKTGETFIELVEPLHDKSPLARHLRKHGEGLAHICFATEDLAALRDSLDEKDILLTSREGLDGALGRKVMFLHPKENSNTLTEFAEHSKDPTD